MNYQLTQAVRHPGNSGLVRTDLEAELVAALAGRIELLPVREGACAFRKKRH